MQITLCIIAAKEIYNPIKSITGKVLFALNIPFQMTQT